MYVNQIIMIYMYYIISDANNRREHFASRFSNLAFYHLKVYRPAIWTQLSRVYKLFKNKILRSYKQDKYDDII